MDVVTDALKQLIETDKNLAELLETYTELDRIYRESLQALGQTTKIEASIGNTAEVTASFAPPASSANWSSQ